jgi:hypothetical protein
MLLGKDKLRMRDSISRLGPIMEGSPRLAAMQASKSLPSSSRTWFSTGINKTGFFGVMPFVNLRSRFHPAKNDWVVPTLYQIDQNFFI